MQDKNTQAVAQKLVNVFVGALKGPDGRVRAEDLISAAAAIVGERCIVAAGDFPATRHKFTPGSHVFSDRVNEILCGDNPANATKDIPADSVFGSVRDLVLAKGYGLGDFPVLESIFAGFAARIGNPSEWGWVPLSVPEENRPFIMPLRAAYELRTTVDRLFDQFRDEPTRCLDIATVALAQVLITVKEAIDARVAILLALETVNGMAKTAPMTDDGLRKAAQNVPPKRNISEAKPQKPHKPWWRFW